MIPLPAINLVSTKTATMYQLDRERPSYFIIKLLLSRVEYITPIVDRREKEFFISQRLSKLVGA